VNLPALSTAISVASDDISAVVAFGGSHIGVMWSNQLRNETYFAVHNDGEAPGSWQPAELVLPGAGCSGACSDDHFNLKTDALGRVFAASKTSFTSSTSPLAILLVREPAPVKWNLHPIGLQRDHHTRPIVLLDEGGNRVYVLATSGESGGTIYMKSAPLDAIDFPTGLGDPFIRSASDARINNATSTKQVVSAASGIVVLASDNSTRDYLHNVIGGPGPTPTPTASVTGSPPPSATPAPTPTASPTPTPSPTPKPTRKPHPTRR
jgi:hypothetical protein